MRNLLALGTVLASSFAPAASPDVAAFAVNALGIDLHRQMPKTGNVCLSPYSIQSALAMTHQGASGGTQKEMAKVLHYPTDKAALGSSFAALGKAIASSQAASVVEVAKSEKRSGPSEPIALSMANRLFAADGFEFRAPFLSAMKDYFGAPIQLMDFPARAKASRVEINDWVAAHTNNRIRDLIPRGGITEDMPLVLVNALHFKAGWQHEFSKSTTVKEPFYLDSRSTKTVSTMRATRRYGFLERPGFKAVTIPYVGDGLHFLIIVPDAVDGLAQVESKLTAESLAACAHAENRLVTLHLPRLRATPPTLDLSNSLKAMGMNSAFDVPKGSANFDAMTPRQEARYPCISKVFHRTFIALDEQGTEAAAATAVAMTFGNMDTRLKPIEVKADRPFLFAIQHKATGACLFLGRIDDPR